MNKRNHQNREKQDTEEHKKQDVSIEISKGKTKKQIQRKSSRKSEKMEIESEQEQELKNDQSEHEEEEMPDFWKAGEQLYKTLLKDPEWVKAHKGKWLALDDKGIVLEENREKDLYAKQVQLKYQPYVVQAAMPPPVVRCVTVNCINGVLPPQTEKYRKVFNTLYVCICKYWKYSSNIDKSSATTNG